MTKDQAPDTIRPTVEKSVYLETEGLRTQVAYLVLYAPGLTGAAKHTVEAEAGTLMRLVTELLGDSMAGPMDRRIPTSAGERTKRGGPGFDPGRIPLPALRGGDPS